MSVRAMREDSVEASGGETAMSLESQRKNKFRSKGVNDVRTKEDSPGSVPPPPQPAAGIARWFHPGVPPLRMCNAWYAFVTASRTGTLLGVLAIDSDHGAPIRSMGALLQPLIAVAAVADRFDDESGALMQLIAESIEMASRKGRRRVGRSHTENRPRGVQRSRSFAVPGPRSAHAGHPTQRLRRRRAGGARKAPRSAEVR